MNEELQTRMNLLNKLLADIYPDVRNIKVGSLLQSQDFSREEIEIFTSKISVFLDDVIHSMRGALTYEQANIIILKYGLVSVREMPLDEICKTFGITEERVKLVQDSAFEKLRERSLVSMVIYSAHITTGKQVGVKIPTQERISPKKANATKLSMTDGIDLTNCTPLFTITKTMQFQKTIPMFQQSQIIASLRDDGYIVGELIEGVTRHSTAEKGRQNGFIGIPTKEGIREKIYLNEQGQEFIKKYVHGFYNESQETTKSVTETVTPSEKPNLTNTLILFSKIKSEFFAFSNYISKSMIDKFKADYEADYTHIKCLLASNSVASSDLRQAQELITIYENITELSKAHNEKFIFHNLEFHKKYFDNILKTVDANVMLDNEQRRAIIADEDYCLLIAGAGAGKTTTMAAKVKYLVEVKGVAPQDIVVISYTNKAIGELKERINDKLGIPANIITFHKFGYDILKSSAQPPTVEYSAANYVFRCLEQHVFNDKELLRKIMLFLGYYLNIPEEALNFENLNSYFQYKADNDFQTMKSNAGEYIREFVDTRRGQKRTITGEYVRSDQEVQIANFLYLHGIEYEYEQPYSNYKNSKGRPYQPDFTITQNGKTFYIEHFGISENFLSNRFTSADLQKYKNSILFKRKLHKDNGTTLIETFSSYNDRRSLMEHLKEQLERFGITVTKRSDEEVYKKLIVMSKEKYVFRFGYLILDFINRYKECGYDKDGFKLLRQKHDNVRTSLFLDIAETIYNYYQEQLASKNSVDFADMINNAELMLREAEEKKIHLLYRYIIIDEFQDIARQRFNLTKTLANITGAKIVAVGDDWQSIFAFAGSDITLFQRFLELMGHGIEMQINHTYRNSQELIDIAGGFIQKNPTQITKRLISPKRIQNPIEIVEYDGTQSALINWINVLDEIVGKIVQQYGEKSTILFITRFNYEKDRITNKKGSIKNHVPNFVEGKGDSIVWAKNKNVKIDCLTAHSSKGLGYDNVVVINMMEATFGFPSQLDDDPVLKLVTTQDLSVPYAEERRLFYVALTRTKNKVFLVTPSNKPSRFILELIDDYKIKHSEQLSLEIKECDKMRCPLCKAKLKYQPNNRFGIPLYMCTNDPEICDFMTNSKQCFVDISKCPDCDDGYLIVKNSSKNNNYFYGCSDFPRCKNTLPIPNELKPKKEPK